MTPTITPEDCMLLLATAQTVVYAEVPPIIVSKPKVAAQAWSSVLSRAGVTMPMAMDALHEYAAEGNDTHFRKPFPEPGHIIARSPMGRAIKFLGSSPDADRAFADFRRRLGSVGSANLSRSIPARSLDPNDAYRNDAMFTALDACGGASKWGALDLSHPATVKEWQARWTATYVAEREKQRADIHAVGEVARRLIASVETSQRRIGVGS